MRPIAYACAALACLIVFLATVASGEPQPAAGAVALIMAIVAVISWANHISQRNDPD